MINLLPPEEKEKLVLEKKKKMLIIFWFLFLFHLLCLVLILFPIKIYLQGQIDSQKNLLLISEKETEQSEAQNIRNEINAINAGFIKLNSFYQNKKYFSEILEKISRLLPQGAYLNN